MNTATDVSESEFLRIEAEKAKLALAASLKKAKAAIGNSVDPRAAARRHPLVTIGTAAIAGFVTTVAMVPSKQERELRYFERLRRAMNPEPPKSPPVEAKHSGNGAPPVEKKPFWMVVLKEVIAFAKPILLAQITSHLKAEAVPRPATDADQTAQGPNNTF
jgi:hypothetical protein